RPDRAHAPEEDEARCEGSDRAAQPLAQLELDPPKGNAGTTHRAAPATCEAKTAFLRNQQAKRSQGRPVEVPALDPANEVKGSRRIRLQPDPPGGSYRRPAGH